MMVPLLSAFDFFGNAGVNWMDNWFPMCILATLLAVTIHATLIAFSKAFKMTELEHYAESEILQALATAFIAIFLVGLVGGATDFVGNIVGTGGSYVTCGNTQMPVGLRRLPARRCSASRKKAACSDCGTNSSRNQRVSTPPGKNAVRPV